MDCCTDHLRPQWSHHKSGCTADSAAHSWCRWWCRLKHGHWRTVQLQCSSRPPQHTTSPKGLSWCSSPKPQSRFWVCRELKDVIKNHLLSQCFNRLRVAGQWHMNTHTHHARLIIFTWFEINTWAWPTWTDIVLCCHLDIIFLSTVQVGQSALCVFGLAGGLSSLCAQRRHFVRQSPPAGTPGHSCLILGAVHFYSHISRNTRSWFLKGGSFRRLICSNVKFQQNIF